MLSLHKRKKMCVTPLWCFHYSDIQYITCYTGRKEEKLCNNIPLRTIMTYLEWWNEDQRTHIIFSFDNGQAGKR